MHNEEGTAASILNFSPSGSYNLSKRCPFPCPALARGSGVLQGETRGQTQVRGNHCSRCPSNQAEPQQITGMSHFTNEGKAVPRTSPFTEAPQPPSPRLCEDWVQDFIRTLNSEAVKSLCKKPIIPIFITANLSLYLSPFTYP